MSHIFISYSHKDTKYAHRLADTLKEKGFEVWIDARLDYGSQWSNEIQQQLDTCGAFIVLMSPRSYASEWVQNELNRAKRKAKAIFPFLLDGDEPWLIVESTQFIDVRGEILPDNKFYTTLERFVSRSKEQVSTATPGTPAPVTVPVKVAQKLSLPAIFAIPGVFAMIVLGIVWLAGNRATPTITETPEVLLTVTTPSKTVETEVAVTNVPVEIVPFTVTPLPGEFIDANEVEMVLVTAGDYLRGSDNGDADAKPAQVVHLDAYYIDKFEVTNSHYAECVSADVCIPPKQTGSFTRTKYYGNPEFDRYPVLYVDWYMARSYCSWRGAHLPTEAQWEIAARGKEEFIYPWGNSFECRNGNFDDETRSDEFMVPGGPNCDGYQDTAPVGSYPNGQSTFGVFDMTGNVWEWVADSYLENYYATLGDNASNPQGPSGGEYQVVRGGSWGSNENVTRAWYRGKYKSADFYDYLGFRCAMDVSP